MSPDDLATRRRMNLMASVSRSSGLEQDGDDLKNYKTQEEYREFIQEKAFTPYKFYSMYISLTGQFRGVDEKKQRIDIQENLLIIFREKLREGVASSSRKDAFALETYETSLYISIIFKSPKQTTSIIPHLFPPRISGQLQSAGFTLASPSIFSLLNSLLHYLVTFYPSQGPYHQHLGSIPETLLPNKSQVSTWLSSLTKSLRMRNYARFAVLSQRATVVDMLETSVANSKKVDTKGSSPHGDDNLGLKAVLFLVDTLRKKAADTAWAVIRSAYRELSCDQASVETKTWLTRSLCLESAVADSQNCDVETWLERMAPLGHVRRKEGIEGRWIVCKAR
ncbi:hypothetical protein BDZ97DRAFT_1660629 [Flammula alnicola]|nr:hypothetical protein BDZ97DRAFT_1660629 [Flammula alnicola]